MADSPRLVDEPVRVSAVLTRKLTVPCGERADETVFAGVSWPIALFAGACLLVILPRYGHSPIASSILGFSIMLLAVGVLAIAIRAGRHDSVWEIGPTELSERRGRRERTVEWAGVSLVRVTCVRVSGPSALVLYTSNQEDRSRYEANLAAILDAPDAADALTTMIAAVRPEALDGRVVLLAELVRCIGRVDPDHAAALRREVLEASHGGDGLDPADRLLCLCVAGMLDQASPLIDEAIEAHPTRWDTRLCAAVCARFADDVKRCADELAAAAQYAPSSQLSQLISAIPECPVRPTRPGPDRVRLILKRWAASALLCLGIIAMWNRGIVESLVSGAQDSSLALTPWDYVPAMVLAWFALVTYLQRAHAPLYDPRLFLPRPHDDAAQRTSPLHRALSRLSTDAAMGCIMAGLPVLPIAGYPLVRGFSWPAVAIAETLVLYIICFPRLGDWRRILKSLPDE